MITFPNAKINLGLDIVEKRPDGYHNLETVFYPIPLCDILEITPATDKDAPDYTFKMYNAVFEGNDDDNLVIKAYKALAADHKLPKVDISLYKHIPTGAGLGGGSADAAFALKMLNEIAALGLTAEELRAYAARIGADCAFFIYNTPMMATGIGDILSLIDVQLKGKTLLLVKPNVSVPTAEAYSRVTPKPSEIELSEILSKPICEWKNLLKNDFEPSVFSAHPELSLIKEQIYGFGAEYASMSGSGSSIFGIFESANMAENAKSAFAESDAYVINL